MGIVKSNKARRSVDHSFVNLRDDKRGNFSEANTASQGFVVVTHEELEQLRVAVYPYIL